MQTNTIRFYTVPAVADCKVLRRNLADAAGGYTVTYGIGGWVDANGDVIEEPQATVEVVTDTDIGEITGYVVEAARAHKEVAVLRTVNLTESTMVSV